MELLELNKYKYKYAKYQPRSQGLHCRLEDKDKERPWERGCAKYTFFR